MSKNRIYAYHTVINTFILAMYYTTTLYDYSIKPLSKVHIYGQLSDKLFYCDSGTGRLRQYYFWTTACSFNINWNDWNKTYEVCTDIQASQIN